MLTSRGDYPSEGWTWIHCSTRQAQTVVCHKVALITTCSAHSGRGQRCNHPQLKIVNFLWFHTQLFCQYGKECWVMIALNTGSRRLIIVVVRWRIQVWSKQSENGLELCLRIELEVIGSRSVHCNKWVKGRWTHPGPYNGWLAWECGGEVDLP